MRLTSMQVAHDVWISGTHYLQSLRRGPDRPDFEAHADFERRIVTVVMDKRTIHIPFENVLSFEAEIAPEPTKPAPAPQTPKQPWRGRSS